MHRFRRSPLRHPSLAGLPVNAPLLALVAATTGHAQDVAPAAGRQEAVVPVAPVVVTPTRGAESSLEVPATIDLLSLTAARERLPVNTPDALREVPGLMVQKSNQGGGSPVLRGRTGKDVVLLLDGQRFSNSTFRRNHQYLNTVDLFALDGIEVVHGPASVLYGSDAMGGAVNLLGRRRALEGFDDWGGRLVLQHETANRSLLAHADADAEIDGFGVFAGITSRWFDDLVAGNSGPDPLHSVETRGAQDPSAYRDRAFNVSLARRLGEHDTLDWLLLYSRQWDVPASDRLIANDKNPTPRDLEREFDPQRLSWNALRWHHQHDGALLESAQVIASLNTPVEGRRRVQVATPTLETVERDEVTAPGLSALVGLRVDAAHLLTIGGEGYFERIDSDGVTIDHAAGTTTPNANGRYPDGARYDTLGFYLQDEWRLGQGVEWINGVRWSRIAVDLDFDGLTVGTAGPFGEFDEVYDDVTFATGLSREFAGGRAGWLSLSRGFRAPNLDDLAAIGDFAAGDRVPNLDVDPEKVWNAEIGVRRFDPRTRGQFALAVAWYDDLLVNEYAFSSGGSDFYAVQNAGRAVIGSAECFLEQAVIAADARGWRHVARFQAAASVGRNRSDREPVSKIPAPEALLGWRIEAGEGGGRPWWAESFVRGALAQRRLAAVDEADPRIPEDGTPAWWTLNFRAGLDLTRSTTLTLGLENLLNRRYRLHGSGLDAPGRNFIAALEWRF
ncbi:MAG: TonB-dependent receptor [Planctomycetes bacterium]|nr:TonB-dependent receptor [Planctomycetota bacterium]